MIIVPRVKFNTKCLLLLVMTNQIWSRSRNKLSYVIVSSFDHYVDQISIAYGDVSATTKVDGHANGLELHFLNSWAQPLSILKKEIFKFFHI